MRVIQRRWRRSCQHERVEMKQQQQQQQQQSNPNPVAKFLVCVCVCVQFLFASVIEFNSIKKIHLKSWSWSKLGENFGGVGALLLLPPSPSPRQLVAVNKQMKHLLVATLSSSVLDSFANEVVEFQISAKRQSWEMKPANLTTQ